MRDNIKNTVLVLALVIAGISLPTSIMSIMNKPTTPITEVNNYYYNNTVIERYNTTIIEQYNTTIVINNTIYEYPNSTMEIYHFKDFIFEMENSIILPTDFANFRIELENFNETLLALGKNVRVNLSLYREGGGIIEFSISNIKSLKW